VTIDFNPRAAAAHATAAARATHLPTADPAAVPAAPAAVLPGTAAPAPAAQGGHLPVEPAAPPAAPIAAPPAVPGPGAAAPGIREGLLALCEQEPLLGPLQRLLQDRPAVNDSTAVRGLNIVEDILVAAGNGSRRVETAHATLRKAVLQGVNRLDGPADHRAAAWFHASCKDLGNPTLLTALAEALVRCQPAAPTPAHVFTAMKAFLAAKVLPKLGQWDGLFKLAARHSVVSQLDGTAVLELLTWVQLLLRGNEGRMPLDAARAMQRLFASVVDVVEAGRASLQQCVQVIMGVCADMFVVPEALVALAGQAEVGGNKAPDMAAGFHAPQGAGRTWLWGAQPRGPEAPATANAPVGSSVPALLKYDQRADAAALHGTGFGSHLFLHQYMYQHEYKVD